MLPACSVEMAQEMGFLTSQVFLCTDGHFKAWGYLKSLSWCFALLWSVSLVITEW